MMGTCKLGVVEVYQARYR